jgi:hypothetical protein
MNLREAFDTIRASIADLPDLKTLEGRRNSAEDQASIQETHDLIHTQLPDLVRTLHDKTVGLGASCPDADDDTSPTNLSAIDGWADGLRRRRQTAAAAGTAAAAQTTEDRLRAMAAFRQTFAETTSFARMAAQQPSDSTVLREAPDSYSPENIARRMRQLGGVR